MQQNEDYVLRILQDVGLVTRHQIESAQARLNGATSVVDVLIRDGIVSDADVSRTLAAQAHMDWIDISSMVIPPQIIKQIRAEEARRFKVIPVGFGETGLVVAVGDPLDIDTIDSLSFLLQRELEVVCTSPQKIREALIKYYGTADEAAEMLREKIGEDVDPIHLRFSCQCTRDICVGNDPIPNQHLNHTGCAVQPRLRAFNLASCDQTDVLQDSENMLFAWLHECKRCLRRQFTANL